MVRCSSSLTSLYLNRSNRVHSDAVLLRPSCLMTCTTARLKVIKFKAEPTVWCFNKANVLCALNVDHGTYKSRCSNLRACLFTKFWCSLGSPHDVWCKISILKQKHCSSVSFWIIKDVIPISIRHRESCQLANIQNWARFYNSFMLKNMRNYCKTFYHTLIMPEISDGNYS